MIGHCCASMPSDRTGAGERRTAATFHQITNCEESHDVFLVHFVRSAHVESTRVVMVVVVVLVLTGC